MPHTIQIFNGGCGLCKRTIEIVEVGKCEDCKMEVINVMGTDNDEVMKRYDITAVPSIVIDGRIKVVGLPQFPWFCGDEFYKMLETKYSLSGYRDDWLLP